MTLSFKKATLQKNFVIAEEELDDINADDIRNSHTFVFIDEECENLIIVNDGWELTRNIN